MTEKYEKLNYINVEQEALTILMEECAEVTQEAAKCIRFNQGEIINQVRLSKEIGDLLALVEILIKMGLVSEHTVMNSIEEKKNKLKFYSNLPFLE